jgi:hypothetical protein
MGLSEALLEAKACTSDTAAAALATLLDGAGISSAEELRAATLERLTAIGVKKGPRVKILRWAAATNYAAAGLVA